MNALDVVVVLAAVAAAIGGYRLGLVTRFFSWIGLGLGLFLAVRALPWLVEHVDRDRGVLLSAAVGLVFAGAFLGQALGYVVGARVRPRHTDGTITRPDGMLGAAAGVVGVVVVLWLLLPVLAGSPGWMQGEVETSWVAQQVDDHLPDPPDAVDALRSLVGDDRFPDVFAALQPTPALGPPPPESGLDEATAARVARSVVKVEGVACRRVQDGSGFVVDDQLVVTNAHVVAGEAKPSVERDDGRRVSTEVVAFDPARDLALLRAPGLDRPALPIGAVATGTRGGVFGHPGGEPLRIAPFEVARRITATGHTIYGTGETDRHVLELAAALRPGDSGAALVDPAGEVVGVAFAIARDQGGVAYALAPDELRAALAGPRAEPVSTGPCL